MDTEAAEDGSAASAASRESSSTRRPGVGALWAATAPSSVLGRSGHVYEGTSLFCLRPSMEPRRLAIGLVESPPFEPIVLLTIAINCGAMSWESPLDPPGTQKAEMLRASESYFLGIFTFELLCRVLAYGFVRGKHSYLRDRWCQLDFLVVTLGWLPIFFPALGSVSLISTARALRPLRILKYIPGMPILVESIIASVRQLLNVVVLCVFLFVIFATVGVELFKGELHWRCAIPGYDGPGSIAWPAPDSFDSDEPCAAFSVTHGDAVCPDGSRCVYFASNPAGNLTSFDSVLAASTSILQAVTFDGWTGPMYRLMSGSAAWAWLYFVAAAVLGGMFVLNLFLAVIFDAFQQGSEARAEEARQAREALRAMLIEAQAQAEADGAPQVSWADRVGASALLGALPLSGLPPLQLGRVPGFGHATTLLSSQLDRVKGLGARVPGLDSAALLLRGHLGRVPNLDAARLALSLRRGAEAEGGVCDCKPRSGWRLTLGHIAASRTLGGAATALVLINVFIMCLPYAGQPAEGVAAIERAGLVISLIFIAEMLLKLLGLGCRGYWSDGWNALDGAIVLLTSVDLAVVLLGLSSGVNVSFFRVLRVARMLRLMKAWRGLYRVCTAFVRALPQLSNLLFLVVLVMTIFALIGIKYFGGAFVPLHEAGGETPRLHFDYFGPAMLSVFVLLTGAWFDGLEACAEAVGFGTAMGYFFAALLVGFLVLMNLFVAILAESFTSDADEEEEQGDMELAALWMRERLLTDGVGLAGGVLTGGVGLASGVLSGGVGLAREGLVTGMGLAGDVLVGGGLPTSDALGAAVRRVESARLSSPPDADLALGLLSPANPLRRACAAIVKHPLFERLFLLLILAACVCTAADSPRLDPASDYAWWVSAVADATTLFFTLEAALKVVALGLIDTPGAYLKDGWNVLDLVIALVSLSTSSLAVTYVPQLGNLYAFRALRVLRPLRLVEKEPGVRLILFALLKAMPAVSSILAVLMAFQIVFAILGMQLFMGALGSCSIDPGANYTTCGALAAAHAGSLPAPPPLPPPLAAPLAVGGSWLSAMLPSELDAAVASYGAQEWSSNPAWLNPSWGSFDDFGQAMLVLYVTSTGDGWEDVMFAQMDSTGVRSPPERNDFSPAAAFMLAWMVVGSFMALNLFVGAIIDNFQRIKDEDDTEGPALVTPAQRQWISAVRLAASKKPLPLPSRPANLCRAAAFRLVTSAPFELGLLLVVLLNVGAMSCDYWQIEADGPTYALYLRLNAAFTGIYYAEAALKIFGLGPRYFSDPWSRLDFGLVCISLFDQLASNLLASMLPVPAGLLRVLRILRILRILRLLKTFRGLRDLLKTIALSFPALVNVSSLLALVVFMYAVVGMQLFTFVMHGDGITDQRNFETVPSAALLLFQCLTGDEWSLIMSDASVTHERGCSPTGATVPYSGEKTSDCGSAYATPFFVSFMVVGSFILLNLIVAVILDNFSALNHQRYDLVSAADVELFHEAWAKLDPGGSGKASAAALPLLVSSLPPPLGLKQEGTSDAPAPSHALVYRRAQRLCIHLGLARRPEFSFHEVFDKLAQANATEALGERQLAHLVGAYEMPPADGQAAARQSEPPWRGTESAAALSRSNSRGSKLLTGRRKSADAAAVAPAEGTLPPREGHSKVTYGGRVFLFGGRTRDGQPLKDFWMFSSETGAWSDLSHTVPFGLSPRFGHTATLHDKWMVIIGGRDGKHVLSDVWECDVVHLIWIRSSHVWTSGEEDGDPSPPATRAAPDPPTPAHDRGSARLTLRPAASGLPPWWAQLPGDVVVDAIAAVQAAARRRALRIRFSQLIKLARAQGKAATRVQAAARGWAARQSPSKKVWY